MTESFLKFFFSNYIKPWNTVHELRTINNLVNWCTNNPFVGPSETTFGPNKRRKITKHYNILANQKTESFAFHCQHAHAVFDEMCFLAFVSAFDVISNIHLMLIAGERQGHSGPDTRGSRLLSHQSRWHGDHGRPVQERRYLVHYKFLSLKPRLKNVMDFIWNVRWRVISWDNWLGNWP